MITMFVSEVNLDKQKVNSAHKVIIALWCNFVIRELINLLFLYDPSWSKFFLIPLAIKIFFFPKK